MPGQRGRGQPFGERLDAFANRDGSHRQTGRGHCAYGSSSAGRGLHAGANERRRRLQAQRYRTQREGCSHQADATYSQKSAAGA